MEIARASLLSLLTISEQVERVILAYCSETEDEAPPELYWYPKKGKNGDAEYLWQEKKLKQWLVVGSDSEIHDLWNKLISDKVLHCPWGVSFTNFLLPQSQKVDNPENYVAIKGIPACGRNQTPEEYE